MTKFYYLKAKEVELFLSFGNSSITPSPSQRPHMFGSKVEAFNAYEEYRSKTKMAGKPTILFDLKEIDL